MPGVVSISYELRYSKRFAKDLKRIIRSGKPEMRSKVNKVLNELKKDPHSRRPSVDIKLISKKKKQFTEFE